MKDLPACRECKRTHTSMGNPVRLKAHGDWVGLCQACAKAFALKFGPLPEPRGVESDTRALEYWLNSVYRRRRRVNAALAT